MAKRRRQGDRKERQSTQPQQQRREVVEAVDQAAAAEVYPSRHPSPLRTWITILFWMTVGTSSGLFFWVLRREPVSSLGWFAILGALAGALLTYKGLPGLRHLVWWGAWAALGIFACGSVWLSQSLGPNGPTAPLWVFVVVGAGFGTMIGFFYERTHPRRCPRCGKSMGFAQNFRYGGAERAIQPENRIPDGALWAKPPLGIGRARISGLTPVLKTYYLCKRCDREYLAICLDYRNHAS